MSEDTIETMLVRFVRELNLAGTPGRRRKVVKAWGRMVHQPFIDEGIERAGLNADLTYPTPASSNDNGTNSSKAD